MKTGAIIQARFASTRLLGKVLIKVMDKTILEHVIERVKRAKKLDKVILATTENKEDDKLEDVAGGLDIEVYRGSQNDVLDRFYKAASLFDINPITRITADCPLIDPGIIDGVIDCYNDSEVDYCSNTLNPTFPDGEDVEVFSFEALVESWKNAKLPSQREHVTPYIKEHPDRFKLLNFAHTPDLSRKRWTLDKKEDLEFIKTVIEFCYPVNPYFGMEDILRFISLNPAIENMNRHIMRNEGYLKSLSEDEA